MAHVYVSVGSNIEPASNIRSAICELRRHYPQLVLSSVYESEAVGFSGDNFYNLVVGFETDDDVHRVAEVLSSIEASHARDRRAPKFSSRTIDLDLLLYDAAVINENGLNIPRDEITKNAFVLWPLAEIAGDLIHPQTRRSYAEMWRDYDKARQSLWAIPFDWD